MIEIVLANTTPDHIKQYVEDNGIKHGRLREARLAWPFITLYLLEVIEPEDEVLIKLSFDTKPRDKLPARLVTTVVATDLWYN